MFDYHIDITISVPLSSSLQQKLKKCLVVDFNAVFF